MFKPHRVKYICLKLKLWIQKFYQKQIVVCKLPTRHMAYTLRKFNYTMGKKFVSAERTTSDPFKDIGCLKMIFYAIRDFAHLDCLVFIHTV